jgi:hypothetical protein
VDFVWKPLSDAWKGNERRRSAREEADQPVRILLPAKEVTIHGRLINLSEKGCCVEPNEQFLVWNSIRVEIRFEASQMQFKLAGVTRGGRGGKSFGVEFDSMSVERLAELKLLLPKRHLPHIIVAAEVALSETDAAALSEAGTHPDAEQPNPPKGKGRKPTRFAGIVRVENPPGGRERRVHARYLMEAQAAMLLVKSGETVNGHVLEISQSGCRIFLDAPFEKEIGAHVEVNFSLHGIPVRMAGISQVRMNTRTIGIEFFGLSGRKQQQLLELIAEIREAISRLEAAE